MFVEGDDHRFTRAVPQFYLQRRGGNMIQSRPSNYYLLEALTSSYKKIIQGSVTSVHPVWCDAINDLLVEREEEVRKFTR